MISTRTFARYTSMWAVLTPTLEHVVRWLNENRQVMTWRVPTTGGEPGNNSLIAESAFAVVAAGLDRPSSDLNQSDIAQVREYLQRFSINPPNDNPLDADELYEIGALVESMRGMFGMLPNPTFWPPVPGCGVVDAAYADVLEGETLYEVKTVTRAFRSGDVRQLLTYAAMLEASGTSLRRVGLLNPRLGTGVTVSLDFVAQGASGLTRVELMRDLMRRMAEMPVSG